MINHPHRSAGKPFIAFSLLTYQSLAWGNTASEARARAMDAHKLDDDAFIEVLACQTGGRKIWADQVPLVKARHLNVTVFRGAGDEPHAPAVPLTEG